MPHVRVHTDHPGIRLVLGVVGAHGLVVAVVFLLLATVQAPCAQHAVDCLDRGGLFLLMGIIAALVGASFVVTAAWAGFRRE